MPALLDHTHLLQWSKQKAENDGLSSLLQSLLTGCRQSVVALAETTVAKTCNSFENKTVFCSSSQQVSLMITIINLSIKLVFLALRPSVMLLMTHTHTHQIVMCDTSTMAADCWVSTTFCSLTFQIQPTMTSSLPVAGHQPAGRGNKHPLGAVGGLSCALVSQRLHKDYFCCDCQSLSSLFYRGRTAADLLRASHVSARGCSKMVFRLDSAFAFLQLTLMLVFFLLLLLLRMVQRRAHQEPRLQFVPSMTLKQQRCSQCRFSSSVFVSHDLKYAHT